MVSVRKVAGFIALVGLVLGLTSVAVASQHGRTQGQREITGRVGAPEMVLQGPVISVHPNVGFIVIRHGTGPAAEEIPVEVDARTTLMRAGQRINIDAVRTGDRARISYQGSPGDVSKRVDLAGTGTSPARRTGAGGRM